MSTQYFVKLGSIRWQVGQGKAVDYSIIDCDMSDEGGKREIFRVKVEVSIQFRDHWKNKLAEQDFTKLVCWFIDQELQKRGFPPRKDEGGFVEITGVTTQRYPSLPCSQQDLQKYESINEFVIELP